MKQGAEEPGRFGIWSEIVIGACIEVHRHLGPGLLESVYEECLCYELSAAGIAYQRQRCCQFAIRELTCVQAIGSI